MDNPVTIILPPSISAYEPPTTRDISTLKHESGLTNYEMAQAFGISPLSWRKYTGGDEPRQLALQDAFFFAAHQTLDAEQLALINDAMVRLIGARWDVNGPPMPKPVRPEHRR